MPKFRRKLSAVTRDFQTELKRLERFDAINQTMFSTSASVLSKHQLHFLTEAIFFRAFRAYEKFLGDIFLLYCLEKRPRSGAKVTAYLNPKSFAHAEKLIQGSQRFLDWLDPDTVISRAEVYLKDGFPIKLPYSTNREVLKDLKKIRNHVAHDSKESYRGYQSVLMHHYRTIPLRIPSPGEFLLLSDLNDPTKYKLLVFFDLMRTLSIDLT